MIVLFLYYSSLRWIKVIKESIFSRRTHSQQCILESFFDSWTQNMCRGMPKCSFRLFKIHHFDFTVTFDRTREIYKFPILNFIRIFIDLICVNNFSDIVILVFDFCKKAFLDPGQTLQKFDSSGTSLRLSYFDHLLILISDMHSDERITCSCLHHSSFSFEFRKSWESLLNKGSRRCFH